MADLELPRHVHKPGRKWLIVKDQGELDAAVADGWYVDPQAAYAADAAQNAEPEPVKPKRGRKPVSDDRS